MIHFTLEEKKLILQSLDLLFQAGAIRGSLEQVESTLNTAKSIKIKIQYQESPEKEST